MKAGSIRESRSLVGRLIIRRRVLITDVEKLAGKLYGTYCAAVGGRAFNGDPLPTWEEFRADPNKQKQAEAWIAVARCALEDCGSRVGAAVFAADAVDRIKRIDPDKTLTDTMSADLLAKFPAGVWLPPPPSSSDG